MTMMLLEWVLTSVFLILTVLALRAAFGRRVSARLRYALWAVVLARLLVPVQLFTSPLAGTWFFSESRTEQTVTEWPITSEAHATPGADDWLSLSSLGEPLTNFPAAPRAPDPPTVSIIAPEAPAAPDLSKAPAWLGWVWLGGSIALALVLAASNLRFALCLRRSRIPLEGADCPLPVYAAVGLPSPCLFGLIRPTVYVTPEAAADPAMLRHVIAHEYTHFRQGDHLWSFLRCAALAIHWWNPLVWVSVKLSRRDGELACDDGALKRLGDSERLAYGNTLLALVTAKPGPGDLLCFATTMTGEKKSLRERISRIACAPKRWLWAGVAVVLTAALACVCAFGQAEKPEQTDGPDGNPTPSAAAGPDTDLPELTPTYSMNWNGAVLVEGLGGAYAEWFDPGLDPYLDFDGASFCCPGLADRMVFGSGSWTDEARTAVRVTVKICDDRAVTEPDSGCLREDAFPVGFRIQFTAELDSGTVLEQTSQSWVEGETLELTDREMVTMARVLAKLLTGAEGYYQSHAEQRGLLVQELQTDLDRDGVPETVQITELYSWSGQLLELWKDDELIFTEDGYYAHAGYNAVFLCTLDGKDYLLRYHPNGSQGDCYYEYQLFILTRDGKEQVVRENSIRFNIHPGSPLYDGSFDPEAIAAFMDEINSLLAHSVQLINTDNDLLDTFRKEGRLYDSLGWLDYCEPDFVRDETASLLENLRAFQKAREAEQYVVVSPMLTGMSESPVNTLIRLNYKDKSTQFIADWWDFAYQPAEVVNAQVLDLNGDGKDEIVFPLVWGHGTGAYIEKLYVFDAETLEQYDTSGLNEMILSSVVSTGDKDNFYLSVGGSRVTIPKSEAQKDNPDAPIADELSLGNIIRYTVEDGQLFCWLGCDASGLTFNYIGYLNILVNFTSLGSFSCGSAQYINVDTPFE